MTDQERELDMALAECEQENRLLRARNERLERELAEAITVKGITQNALNSVIHMRQQIKAQHDALLAEAVKRGWVREMADAKDKGPT